MIPITNLTDVINIPLKYADESLTNTAVMAKRTLENINKISPLYLFNFLFFPKEFTAVHIVTNFT